MYVETVIDRRSAEAVTVTTAAAAYYDLQLVRSFGGGSCSLSRCVLEKKKREERTQQQLSLLARSNAWKKTRPEEA